MHVDQESVDLDGLADFVAGAAAAFDGVERVAEEVEPHHRGFAALPSDRAVWGGHALRGAGGCSCRAFQPTVVAAFGVERLL